jgi:hypothetical protein
VDVSDEAATFPKSAVPVAEGEASPLVEPAGDDASTFPESTGASLGATGAADDVSVVDSVVPDVTDGAVANAAPSVNSFPASVTSKWGSSVKSAAGASNWSPVILLVIFAMMQFLCVIVTPRRRAAQGSLRDL